jgi:hypothetical protein
LVVRAAPLGVLAFVLGCSHTGRSFDEPGETLEWSREPPPSGQYAWFETQKLVVENSTAFGEFVAMSDTAAIVGGSEDGFTVYTLADGAWGEPQKLDTGGATQTDVGAPAVAISGDTALVGIPGSSFGTPVLGSVRVFTRAGSSWPLTAVLDNGVALPFDGFGAAVAIEGDLLVVGAPFAETAYVFARVGSGWVQQKQLFASDNPLTPGFLNRFGEAVAISGGTVAIGASYAGEPDPFVWAGKAYLYGIPSDPADAWPETILVPSVRESYFSFGRALALSGETLLVGAPGDPLGTAYVFTKHGSSWTEQKLTIGNDTYGDVELGGAVAISNERAVASLLYPRLGPPLRPAAYTFVKTETTWQKDQAIGVLVDDVLFGYQVAISGDWLVGGAALEYPGGAAYMYRLLGGAGAACDSVADCGAGNCVSSVCCESACDGACEECSSGACLPVGSGSPGTPACSPYLCDGASGTCPKSCVVNGDCVGKHYCRDGTCAAKVAEGRECLGPEECLSGICVRRRCSGELPNGAPCEDGSNCSRGYCVDGVCCNDACRRQCEACDVQDHEGECTAVTGAPHGERDPCAGAGTVCAGTCDGEVDDACAYPIDLTCASTCESGAETLSYCDGQGECVASDQRPCGNFVCDGDVECKSSCETDGDCSDELSCWADGTCDEAFRCASDFESEAAPGGSLHDCRPYTCAANGRCMTSCSSSDDCAEPNACNEQRCVPVPSGDSEGCGCRIVSRTANTRWPIEVLLAILAFVRRRARA